MKFNIAVFFGGGGFMIGTLKYSVIIPVYNAERTIGCCLSSIIVQQREDVEVILINDGSTDKSKEIIYCFIDNSSCKSEIVYIEQPNSGVSSARNLGLDVARGKYITFIDSDDYVSDDYFAVLDSMEDSDLCVFGNSFSDTADDIDGRLKNIIDQTAEMSKQAEMLVASRKIMPPWNKRFRNEIIQNNGLRFIEDFQIGEDFDFCLAYSLRCHSVNITDKAVYIVDTSDRNSLSRKYRPELDKKMAAVYKHIENNVLSTNNSLFNIDSLIMILDYLFVKNTFSCIAEEFKCEKPNYVRDREKFFQICSTFQYTLLREKKYYNIIHRLLRFLLKRKIIFPFYLVTYLVKWRAFKKYTGKDNQ